GPRGAAPPWGRSKLRRGPDAVSRPRRVPRGPSRGSAGLPDVSPTGRRARGEDAPDEGLRNGRHGLVLLHAGERAEDLARLDRPAEAVRAGGALRQVGVDVGLVTGGQGFVERGGEQVVDPVAVHRCTVPGLGWRWLSRTVRRASRPRDNRLLTVLTPIPSR